MMTGLQVAFPRCCFLHIVEDCFESASPGRIGRHNPIILHPLFGPRKRKVSWVTIEHCQARALLRGLRSATGSPNEAIDCQRVEDPRLILANSANWSSKPLTTVC
jgi:hypothetical protein